MKCKVLALLASLVTTISCSNHKDDYDAPGNFEADEVIVSSQLSGQLLSFNVDEGDTLSKGIIVGKIDSTDVLLQKQQVQASIRSLGEKTSDVKPQIKLLGDQLAVQQTQLNHLLKDRPINKVIQTLCLTSNYKFSNNNIVEHFDRMAISIICLIILSIIRS